MGYKTSGQVDGGWARLSLTFRTEVSGVHTVGIYNDGLGGVVYADDFQLERAETPSNLNLLENGSLQHWGHGWTMGALANYQKGTGLFSTDQYAYSIRVGGDAYTESCASDSGKSRIDKPKNCGKIAPNTPNAMRKPSRGKAQSEGETVQAPGRNSASHFQAARDDRDGRSRYRAAKTPGFFPVIRVVPRARASPLTWGRGLFVW